MESSQAWAVSAIPSYSLGHPMQISVILELEEVGAGTGTAAGAVGMFNIVIVTGDVSFCGKRRRGEKLDLLLRTQECF